MHACFICSLLLLLTHKERKAMVSGYIAITLCDTVLGLMLVSH